MGYRVNNEELIDNQIKPVYKCRTYDIFKSLTF